MDQRSRPRVREGTKIISQPPPVLPEGMSLTRSDANPASDKGPRKSDADDQVWGIEGVYIISVAARLLDMHPQTLRKYERMGLINPGRTIGMLRLYSREDIRKVRLIRHLGNMGLNLAGVEFALATVENLMHLKRRLLASSDERPLQRAIEQEIAAVCQNLNLPVHE